MSKEDLNDLRCIAAEVIITLFNAKEKEQLELLSEQIETSLMAIEESESAKKAKKMLKRRWKQRWVT